MPDVVKLAADLVAIPSVSRDSNLDVASRCEEELIGSGFAVEHIDDDDHGQTKRSLVAVRGEVTGGTFAYFGHTDVVPADDWTGPGGPFDPVVVDDRLYGRGACDMKGSVAAMLTAAAETTAPCVVVLTSDEEVGFGGAKAVVSRSASWGDIVAGGVRGVIGEPTLRRVLHGHKGGLIWRMTARGKQGHTSFGVDASATLAMLPVLAELRLVVEELRSDPRYRSDAFTPPGPTPNVRLTDESPALNVTSASASAQVFLRLVPNADPAELSARMRSVCERHGVEWWSSPGSPAFFRDPSDDYIRSLCELTGGSSSTASYGTDACIFGAVPQLAVLGPGSIEQAHTKDEWIALDELHEGVGLYRRLIEDR